MSAKNDVDVDGANSVHLEGQVSAEPEFRDLPSGTVLATVVVRVPARSGAMTSIPVTIWDPDREVRRLVEGDVVAVEAQLRRRFWAAPDGTRRSRLEVEGRSLSRVS